MDWVPLAAGREGVRRFSSLEEARRWTAPQEFRLPAYLPEYLDWPPAEILAQSRPYPLLLIHLGGRDGASDRLAVRQCRAGVGHPVPTRLRPTRARASRPVSLAGRTAALVVGEGPDGSPCNQISWTEDRLELTVVARAPVEELLRVAESLAETRD